MTATENTLCRWQYEFQGLPYWQQETRYSGSRFYVIETHDGFTTDEHCSMTSNPTTVIENLAHARSRGRLAEACGVIG